MAHLLSPYPILPKIADNVESLVITEDEKFIPNNLGPTGEEERRVHHHGFENLELSIYR